MTIRTPTTKFFVALTDYLRDQTQGNFTAEEEKSGADGHFYKVKIDTKVQRLNTEQREHIRALAESLIAGWYSIKIVYKP